MALSLGHVRDLLNDIKILVAQINRGTSPSTTTVEGLLTSIDGTLVNLETLLTSIDTTTTYADWQMIPGNSVEYTYTGDYVTTITYKTGVSTIFTQTLAYNGSNQVTSITTT